MRCYPSVDDEFIGGGIGEVVGGNWTKGYISNTCFRFQKGMEGYAPYEYQDSGGYWTIGYGVTKIGELDYYNQLKANQPASEEMCAKVFYKTIQENYGSKIVNRCKELGVTKQHQFDALCSLSYNAGIGRVLNDNTLTNTIKKYINSDMSKIIEVWETFIITSNGQVLNGLKARRKSEAQMFAGNMNKVEMRTIPIINKNGGITDNFKGDGWLPS